ncbi:MAG: type IV pilus modification PilV family protein [Acidimicrobiales bacterium]
MHLPHHRRARPGATRGQDGFSLIEVAVALGILALASLLVGTLTSSTVSAATRVRQTNHATAVAYQAFEQANVGGCGTATGAEGPVVSGRLAITCRWGSSKLLAQVGYATYSVTEGRTPFSVTYRSWWVDSSLSLAGEASPCSYLASASVSPDILVEQVLLAWSDVPGVSTPDAHLRQRSEEPVPPDALAFHALRDGGIVVGPFPGWDPKSVPPLADRVTLATSLGSLTLSRVPGPHGCVWFPYLPAGSYTLTRHYEDPSSHAKTQTTSTAAVTAKTTTYLPGA